jgi:multidrug resistance efflux pump
MDWLTVVLAVGSVVLAAAIVIVAARVGIKIPLRGRRVPHTHKAKGEYQPPEPPEGRYWG